MGLCARLGLYIISCSKTCQYDYFIESLALNISVSMAFTVSNKHMQQHRTF